MKKTIFIFILIALTLIFCSCGNSESDKNTDTPKFPQTPDRIVIGHGGEEKTISPEDEAFDKITASAAARYPNESVLYNRDAEMYLSLEDPGYGKTHITTQLRETETFVEYIYDEPAAQYLYRPGESGAQQEEMTLMRIFFPLTGDYHGDFFTGGDEGYGSSATALGRLNDDTELILYVQELVAG